MSARQFSLLPHRSVIAVGGPDRVESKVAPGQAVWAALLTPQGRFLNDMFVVDGGTDTLLLETERERAAGLARKLAMYKLRSKVTVADRGEALEVAVAFGPDAAKALPIAGTTSFVDPRLPELGVRVIAPAGGAAAALQAQGFSAAPAHVYDALRLGLGVPDGSRDLPVDFDELHGVDWDKGCYMGQELTARTKYRGLVRRRLMPVHVEGPLPEPGTLIHLDGKEVGEIRSGSGDRALAFLRLEAKDGALIAGAARIVPEIPGWMRLPPASD